MIVAVVLAAGASSRMGSPKALLPVEGVTFIERIVRAFERTDVDRTLVVLGHNADAMREAIAYLGVDTAVNPDYARGQLSSLHTAIRALEGEPVEAILVHLVDHPFIESGLVNRIIERFRAEQKLIVVPRFDGRRGHPVLFSSKLFPEFLAASHGNRRQAGGAGPSRRNPGAGDRRGRDPRRHRHARGIPKTRKE